MYPVSENTTSDVLFTLGWTSEGCRHRDAFWVSGLNLWRDPLPGALVKGLKGKTEGDILMLDAAEVGLFPESDPALLHRLPFTRVDRRRLENLGVPLACGRFYPQGLLKGLTGVFPANMDPFRVLEMDGDGILADCNPPMAGRSCFLEAQILAVHPKKKERGGSCRSFGEMMGVGPGMQARVGNRPTDFSDPDAFDREGKDPDGNFYRRPRMVHHADTRALETLSCLYAEKLPLDGEILDLMASWTSHLSAASGRLRVRGLGLNAEEMEANPALCEFSVQDLNENAALPFEENCFDAVISSLSVEYLIRPVSVLASVRRVLRPGGLLLLAVSDRWFPPKVIAIWPRLHPFERLGMLREWVEDAGGFRDFETFTFSGFPRPSGDPHRFERAVSDPVFVLAARRES